MKDNKIDELFRQKLSHQKLTPPPSAWAAVEQNLPGEKKKGIYFWISVAAGLLLICTLGWVMLSGEQTRTIPDQTTASTEQQPELIKENQTGSQAMVASNDEAKAEQSDMLKDEIREPSQTQMVASTDKRKESNTTPNIVAAENNTPINDAEQLISKREILIISPIKLKDHLTINSLAREIEFDMIMPLTLTDYHIPYSEDLKPIQKKKKFRVLNGIISIAKEVNSSKLSLSELRNAKNNFITDDLKYGTKTDEGVDDDSEEEPNKD
ncbi:MAG: hypothetical protein Roseis2KO_11090 [Roseivirga sp.]